jgi:hypothetical protein
MDWEIVASVMVGLAIFLVALLAIMISGFMLMFRGMKKKIKAGATPKCPMPFCPLHEKIETAMKQQAQ